MLEILDARRLEKIFKSGRTHPLVIDCEKQIQGQKSGSASLHLMVVKARGLPEVSEQSLFCELFGNLLARELGISTPNPALIRLSPNFVDQANQVLASDHIQIQVGIGVGCEYFPQFYPITENGNMKPEEVEQATRIYAYDLLVQNPDRRQDKPNCANHKGQIVAYDFELCFTFLMALIGVKTSPWEITKHGICLKHFFRTALRAKEVSWAPFLGALQALHKSRLDVIIGELPEGWKQWGLAVQRHIEQVIINIREFEFELQRSLL